MTVKVLIIMTSSGLGGAEQVVLDFLNRPDSDITGFHVLLPNAGPLEQKLKERRVAYSILGFGPTLETLGQRHKINLGSLAKAGRDLIGYCRSFLTLVRQLQPEVIYTHGIKAELLTCLLRFHLKARVVWHLHVFPPARLLLRFVLRWMMPPSCQSIANSNAVRDAYQSIVTHPSHVVYAAIDPQRYREHSKTSAIRSLQLSILLQPDDPVVGMVTVLAPWKGCSLFLRAMAPLMTRFPHLKIVICGSVLYKTKGHDDYLTSLQNQANQPPLKDRVVLLPFQEDPAFAFSLMDIVVHASTEPEPFGRVVSEARLCNRPVIATAGGGVMEQIQHLETGYLIPMGDENALTQAVTHLLNDKTLQTTLARQGRHWVLNHLSLGEFQAGVDEVLHL